MTETCPKCNKKGSPYVIRQVNKGNGELRYHKYNKHSEEGRHKGEWVYTTCYLGRVEEAEYGKRLKRNGVNSNNGNGHSKHPILGGNGDSNGNLHKILDGNEVMEKVRKDLVMNRAGRLFYKNNDVSKSKGTMLMIVESVLKDLDYKFSSK